MLLRFQLFYIKFKVILTFFIQCLKALSKPFNSCNPQRSYWIINGNKVLFHTSDSSQFLIGFHMDISTDTIAGLTLAMTTAQGRMR